MRVFILGLVGVIGCATGTMATEDTNAVTHDDAGFKPSSDAGNNNNSNNNNNNNNNNSTQDAGTNPPPTTCMGTMCGTSCVDTTSDSNNCGMCGNACPSGATCQSSTCVCGTGTLCTGSCVDTTSDPNNCGACGKTCSTSETCTASKCVATSDAPPQGSCSHSLCTAGTALSDGCDTEGCTSLICDVIGDIYCCDTKWDSTCETEVTDYCSPYSCM